ncbi:MAG TPA: protein translocase subunit SecD [Streptosporangiaceae bacterium]|nr:protein translocase subunit SecD [Streptosporangiaceae bacterium]
MLALLAGIIVLLILAIVGGDLASPGKWSQNFKVHLGLDLTSGTTVALQAVKPGGGTPTAAEMQQAIQIMDNRVNGAGVTEAQVVQQGNDIINISVPGQSAQAVVSKVSRTAELQFRQVLLVAPNTPSAAATPSPSPSASASPSSSAKASPSPSASGAASPASATPSPTPTSATSTWQQAQGDASLVSAPVKAQFNKLNCANPNWQQEVGYTKGQYNDPGIQIVSCDSAHNKFVLDKAQVVGNMIASASATPETNSSAWQVNLNFKSNGAKAFGDLTTQMYDKYGTSGSPLDDLAVVLDGTVVSFPSINQGPITGGQAQITGNFSQTSATTLANQLSYGALPLSFHQQSVQSVSPELGRDQLTAGLIAAGLGLILVVLYLVLYYRGLALVAVCSLVIAALLAYLSVVLLGKYQGFALSLAGIAGLIVAIGITADSFVVYFERLRDEVRDGRSLRTAVERGWTRARRTILVADLVSFLAAALLYYFAIGSVRGFAFTLGLITVIDVLVVFTFTKPMMTLLARTKFYGQGHPMSGLDPRRLGARAPWRASPPARVPARATPSKEA